MNELPSALLRADRIGEVPMDRHRDAVASSAT
jgi:hypothetical protein